MTDRAALTHYIGPGEKPHKYFPDIYAMGDCAVCGHTYAAHHPTDPVPEPAKVDAP